MPDALPTPSFWRRPESSTLRIGAKRHKYALRAGYNLDSSFRWNDGLVWIRRLAVLAIAVATAAAHAQTPYPNRTNIEMTVLFPAGSSADVTARLLSQGMSKELSANVIVVNRPGAQFFRHAL